MERISLLSSAAAIALILGTLFSLYPSADALCRQKPLPPRLKDCYLRAQNYSVENYVGGLFCWYCETPVRAHQKGSPQPMKPQQYAYYRELYKKVEPYTKDFRAHRRGKRQAPLLPRCLRKEYRMLTDEERYRFHEAVNALKRNTTVEPNKYDALALFHTGVAAFSGHGGAGFAGWHRIYLMLFEAALQEEDPTVCLPYWDSSLDAALHNPADSYVWSSDFFGTLTGEVVHGPFANWNTPEGMPLRRNVAHDGELFTRRGIEDLMSMNTYEDILMPDGNPEFSLEVLHGGTHVYVGGDMARLDTAPFDCIFFLHHAFVDYIWEMFREKMRNNGYDPEVYPTGPSLSDYHLPSAMMGFGNLTQADGYLDTMGESFEYQPSPSCSRHNTDCGSKYLWCNQTIWYCVPVDPLNPPVPIPGPKPKPQPCPTPRPLANQNSFCVDGRCDVNLWVWMPVKIVAQRPPEFHHYNSYPVNNGKIDKFNDIYEPAAYNDMNRYFKPDLKKPKAYDHCEMKDGIGTIFVSSMGVNYDGIYKETAIIDQRLATSIGVTYLAVKDPGRHGVTEVLLRAHDQCGRVCHTACKIPGTDPPRYDACSGVVELTSGYPRMYGQTYAQATLDVYDYASNADCPTFNTTDFFLTFYCDYRDHIPWVDKVANPISGPHPPRPPPVVRPGGNHNQCRLSPECTINQPCYQQPSLHHPSSPRQCSNYMEMHACLGNCGRYAVCIYGVYWPRHCPPGMHFDEAAGHCVRGHCQNSPHLLPATGGSRFPMGSGSGSSFGSGGAGRFGTSVRPGSSFGSGGSHFGSRGSRFGSTDPHHQSSFGSGSSMAPNSGRPQTGFGQGGYYSGLLNRFKLNRG